ncbi:MAG TPA: glycosyltransferase family 4 protein [Pyrinomonadaceae bacterium]|nr:glycosyltransferase family 4 protein [Pyrinomonadaceae bacterium]
MTRVGILTRTMTEDDAVGNDVLGMYRALKREGHDVRIYAETWSINEPEVHADHSVVDFLKNPSDILIYHHSIGWDLGRELLSKLRCKTVIKYHNVTPPEFFEGISASYVQIVHTGREQLKQIARSNHTLYLSASEYNMLELIEAGAEASRNFVLPPFHHIDVLDSINPDLSVIDRYRTGRANILTVGRVSPNKDHASLIEAFANYYYNYNSNSRLLIVGKQNEAFEPYYQRLRELTSSLCLVDAVILTDRVSNEEMKAYYMISHLFMITSRHEGFCVPLVEAMAMKLPILAYGSTAIPETVGEAGIVWDERNPLLMAEAIDTLIKDKALRANLAEKGCNRYQQLFTNRKIEESFLKFMGELR